MYSKQCICSFRNATLALIRGYKYLVLPTVLLLFARNFHLSCPKSKLCKPPDICRVSFETLGKANDELIKKGCFVHYGNAVAALAFLTWDLLIHISDEVSPTIEVMLVQNLNRACMKVEYIWR